MDDADRADERIAEVVRDGLAKAQRTPDLKPVCRCYYCNEPVPGCMVFCDKECRDDWDWEQARKRANQ